MDAEWWDIVNAIAQSIGAVGTTGALLVAALTYRRQVRDRRSAQAKRIHAWADGDQLQLHNTSDQPIYNVKPVTVAVRIPTPSAADSLQEMLIGRSHVLRFPRPETRATAADLRQRLRVPPGDHLSLRFPEHMDRLRWHGWVFDDENGRTWARIVQDGLLAPVRTRETTPGAWRFKLLEGVIRLRERLSRPGI